MWRQTLAKLRNIKNGKRELEEVLPEWNFYVDQFQEESHGEIAYKDLDKLIGVFKGWQIIGERESTQIIRSFNSDDRNSLGTISDKINDRVLKKMGELETRRKETLYEVFKEIRQHFLSYVYILFIPTMFIFLNALFIKAIDLPNCIVISKLVFYILAGVPILFVCIGEYSMWLNFEAKFMSSFLAILLASLFVMCFLVLADSWPINLSIVQLINAPKWWLLLRFHLYGYVLSYTSTFFVWSMFILIWLHVQFLIKVKRDNEATGVVAGIESL